MRDLALFQLLAQERLYVAHFVEIDALFHGEFELSFLALVQFDFGNLFAEKLFVKVVFSLTEVVRTQSWCLRLWHHFPCGGHGGVDH